MDFLRFKLKEEGFFFFFSNSYEVAIYNIQYTIYIHFYGKFLNTSETLRNCTPFHRS